MQPAAPVLAVSLALLASDTKRRFFEGGWLHKCQGKYYFSYSAGDTHVLVCATSNKPTGKTWLRNIKVTKLKRRADGSIETIVP